MSHRSLSPPSVQSEERSSLGQELAGVQQQITVLRAEVSELRAASDSLQDRITSQEASQFKVCSLLPVAHWVPVLNVGPKVEEKHI